MICTEYDDFISDYIETYPSWMVKLDNGLTVYQDDGRPGTTPHSAWERLFYYCEQTNLYITEMQIRFRTNIHQLPNDMDGYYFSKGARGGIFLPITHQLFFVGVLQYDELNVTCWKVPEMLQEKTERRDPNGAGICLIKRNTSPSLVQKI